MFFVLGSPRSGTTLLAQCLNSHSEIVIPHETDFIVPMVLIVNRIKDEQIGRRLVAELVTNSSQANSLVEFLSPNALRELIHSTEYHPAKILDAVYQAIAKVANKRIAGDKSPNDLGYIGRMSNSGIFTAETKAIHIVRDVRDVMTSLFETKWVKSNAVLYSRLWRQDNLFLHYHFREKEGRYLLVRYEDLVREPKAVLTKICSFLGVKFEKGMLSPENRHGRYRTMSHHQNLFKPISDDRIGRYRESLTPEQIASCEFHAAEALEAFQYAVDTKKSSAKAESTGPKKGLRKLFRLS